MSGEQWEEAVATAHIEASRAVERKVATDLQNCKEGKAANEMLDRYGQAFSDTLTPSQLALCAALDALSVLGREADALALVTHWYSREGILR